MSLCDACDLFSSVFTSQLFGVGIVLRFSPLLGGSNSLKTDNRWSRPGHAMAV